VAREARRWFVRGRVQGVGFRDFVKRYAIALDLSGYAKNLADGRVEVFAQGTPAALDTLAGHLHQGPRWGEVRGVESAPASLSAQEGFSIR
jgi:acylphosphatase